MATTEALIEKILDDGNMPALSFSWCQTNTTKTVAGGTLDTSNTSDPKPVDTNTLFQAASLSKPVSAAMMLELLAELQLKLETPLCEIADYGPPELRADPNYRKLTIGMVLGQSSGLPNWFKQGDKTVFLEGVTPGTQFNYSGVAFQCLKEVIEIKTKKNWETLAHAFFTKVGMKNSTFKQLPASHLKDTREVARGHLGDGKPDPQIHPIDSPEVPAGSLITTATDYMTFLQYCYSNDALRSTLLAGITPLNLADFTKSPFAADQNIEWGFGMGVFTNSDKTIAFHWGNNTGSDAFCAMNMKTGDSVACFVNSENGPNVFQKLADPIVGDLTQLFKWLSEYCDFKAKTPPKSPNSLTELCQSVIKSNAGDTTKFRRDIEELRANQNDSTAKTPPKPL